MSEDPVRRNPRPRPHAYGWRVWGWGLMVGLALWAAGFDFLPWWAVLVLWWWPSMCVGAAVGLFSVWLASLMPANRGISSDLPRPAAAVAERERLRGQGRPRSSTAVADWAVGVAPYKRASGGETRRQTASGD